MSEVKDYPPYLDYPIISTNYTDAIISGENSALKLKCCPFCGNETAPRVMLLSDALFTDKGSPEFEWYSTHYVAVCDFNRGGCGANLICKDGREDEAADAWNRRANDV